MWYNDFADRLEAWAELRNQVIKLPLTEALTEVNNWWQRSPWQPYYLHWDDQAIWPDPWQLLSDNVYCDLARGLGILYTISIMNHPEVEFAELVTTSSGRNLVLVNKEKYILNWDQSSVVNTHPVVEINRRLHSSQITQQLK